MNTHRLISILAVSLLATSAWAQNASQPLNLKLPPGDLPPSDVPAASATAATPAHDAPGVYYGDKSGRTAADDVADTTPTCDDATYNKPQVHGSVSTGVVGGNHVSGNYQAGTVRISKAFGDCAHPSGGMSISISGAQGHFDHDHGH